jgi:hypothetical protein
MADHAYDRSILTAHDQLAVAYGIASPLHYCVGTPCCTNSGGALCAMCKHAVRLVLQRAEPDLIERFVVKAARSVGISNVDVNPIYRGED